MTQIFGCITRESLNSAISFRAPELTFDVAVSIDWALATRQTKPVKIIGGNIP